MTLPSLRTASNCKMILVLFCVSLVLVGYSHAVTAKSGSPSCKDQLSCASCYSAQGCQWCLQEGAADEQCHFNTDCPSTNGNVFLCNENFGSKNRVSISRAILKLNEGGTETFNVTVQYTEDFPLDFYLLLDLSFSLSDDIEGIKFASEDIVDTLEIISEDYHVGLGSFIDKLTYPYVSDHQLNSLYEFEGQPSACPSVYCPPPFSYVHNVNLTNNGSDFISGLDAFQTSTNIDNPEGIFDAISQAVLCNELIGWRNDSLKIIFIVTDAVTHSAGDGKLAGIVKPSSRECKTVFDPNTSSFTYVNNTDYDYPSIGEIRDLLISNGIVPVFGILNSDVMSYYSSACTFMQNSGCNRIAVDSSIASGISLTHELIVSNVYLRFANGAGDELFIGVTASCPKGASLNTGFESCHNVTIGQNVTFTVTVRLNECTEEFRSGSRVILMNIPGYGQFDLQVQGECD